MNELKLYLYTNAHVEEEKPGVGKITSHYLPFVAMDDNSAVEMVRKSAEKVQGTVVTENKYLVCVGSFCPERVKPICDVNKAYHIVCPLSEILTIEKE